jgi:hypothetical protein
MSILEQSLGEKKKCFLTDLNPTERSLLGDLNAAIRLADSSKEYFGYT